jgi:predicted DNA-binding protein
MPTFTMRLPDADYEALQAMSLLTGRAMAELVRDAVAHSITDFAASKELERRYAEELEARQNALRKLTELRAARERDASRTSTDHRGVKDQQESEPASVGR